MRQYTSTLEVIVQQFDGKYITNSHTTGALIQFFRRTNVRFDLSCDWSTQIRCGTGTFHFILKVRDLTRQLRCFDDDSGRILRYITYIPVWYTYVRSMCLHIMSRLLKISNNSGIRYRMMYLPNTKYNPPPQVYSEIFCSECTSSFDFTRTLS